MQNGTPYELCFVKWDVCQEMKLFASKIRSESDNPDLKLILTGQDQDDLDDVSSMWCRCDSVPSGIPFRSCSTYDGTDGTESGPDETRAVSCSGRQAGSAGRR